MYKLVIIRHGESIWNKKNLFTGWTDVDLSKKGEREAKQAGKILKKQGFKFDKAYCSILKRATRTLQIVLKEIDQEKVPKEYSWRLNERHYGALQGVNKKEAVKQYGNEQVFTWRRSFKVKPPALSAPSHIYTGVTTPLTESLEDTWERVLPFWQEKIAPAIRTGDGVLISAHGSTSRALIKYLDNLSDKDIEQVNVPTGIPLVYELDNNLKPIKKYYLGDDKKIKKATKAVEKQIVV